MQKTPFCSVILTVMNLFLNLYEIESLYCTFTAKLLIYQTSMQARKEGRQGGREEGGGGLVTSSILKGLLKRKSLP